METILVLTASFAIPTAILERSAIFAAVLIALFTTSSGGYTWLTKPV